MAQTTAATMATTPETLSAEELHAIQEYEKIIRLRDSILSGSHRIKAPTQLMGNGRSSPQAASQTQSASAPSGYQMDNFQSFKANAQQPAVAASLSAETTGTAKSFGSSRAIEIDPLLLTKSHELIRAELQLQRQRLERSLRDELDQHRISNKANGQASEQVSDFDLSDVLAKALTLVQATAPPATVDVAMAANQIESSDSFDENSFYSSQHDTPEPHISPPAHSASERLKMKDASSSTARPNAHETIQGVAIPGITSKSHRGGLEIPRRQASAREIPDAHVISSNDSGATSRSNSGNADFDQRANNTRLQAPPQFLSNHQFGHQPPLVRAHNLEPFAPQPAHVSPLATARQPAPDPELIILQGAPAQVAALRQQEPANGTSPESSPQGEKGSKKNKKKKNKRKAAELRAMERPASPYIKPEPRSPSPFTSPQYSRPYKRQRPSQRPQQELNYEEQRPGIVHEYLERASREERVDDSYGRPLLSTVPSEYRPERPLYEERRPEETNQYVRHVQSPSGYAIQYAPGEARPMRSTTYSAADPSYRDSLAYPPTEGRMSVRPVTDRARSRSPILAAETRPTTMAPPRGRIIRDEFGREYMEPPPVSRYPIAPAEVNYERPPIRATSRMPAPDTFERDGVIYRRVSPVPSRRVITEPEYLSGNYRDYRHRDYSTQPVPVAVGQEYVQYRGATERRFPEEISREFVRPASIRPVSVRPTEPIRYEYGGSSREFAASVHPEPRREAPLLREYSARPAETVLPRDYSTRQIFYDRPMAQEDRIQREIVFEDGRREVYR